MEKHISLESFSTRLKVIKKKKLKIKSNTEEHKPINFFYYHTNRSHYCITKMKIRVKSKQYIGK